MMYLSDCRACGGEVATKAKTCPHCGQKRPGRFQPVKNGSDVPAAGVFLGIVAVVIVFYFYHFS